MKKITLLLSFSVMALAAAAQSFPILYTFDSVKTTSGTTDPSPLPTVTGVNCGSFSAVGSPANSLAAARFDFADWALGSIGGVADTLYSGMTGSVNTSEYYEVTLTPTGGYTMNLDTIKFSFERSGTGVRTYAVRSSIDGFTTNLPALYIAPNTNVEVETGDIFFLRKDVTTVQNRSNIILGGSSFTNMSAAVSFRFYAWNAEGSGGTFSIDNVRFIGSASTATGINTTEQKSLQVYPNPSSNGLFVIEPTGNTTLSVYDILGNQLLSKTINSKEQIDLSGKAAGTYFLRVESEGHQEVRKLILTR